MGRFAKPGLALLLGLVASWPATSHATTYQVGPGRTYKQLSAVADLLKPGDRVEVDGDASYSSVTFERPGSAAAPITIVGLRVNGKRPIVSGGTNTVMFASPDNVDGGNHYVFEGFEITGGSSRCVFHQAGPVTLRDLVVHDCPQQGILGADNGSGSITLEYSEVYNCGSGTQSHQIYLATDEENRPGSVCRLQFNYIHDGNGGNNVKSRCERNEIYYNWIEGATYREIELLGCDGDAGCSPSTAREDGDIVGNVLVNTSGGWQAVRLGGDKDTGQSLGRYRFVNNTVLLASGASAFWLYLGIESLEIHNNVFHSASGSFELVQDEADWVGGSALIVGSNNWIKTGASGVPAGLSGTVGGSDPGFVNLGGNDLRPGAASPLAGAGNASPTGPSASIPNPLARAAYVPPVRAALAVGAAVGRPTTGAPDIGAYDDQTVTPVPETDGGVAGGSDGGVTGGSDSGVAGGSDAGGSTAPSDGGSTAPRPGDAGSGTSPGGGDGGPGDDFASGADDGAHTLAGGCVIAADRVARGWPVVVVAALLGVRRRRRPAA